ncbi:hypothetical protein DV736_g58, partial [Chaetothyriales sp. CBS 134916]
MLADQLKRQVSRLLLNRDGPQQRQCVVSTALLSSSVPVAHCRRFPPQSAPNQSDQQPPSTAVTVAVPTVDRTILRARFTSSIVTPTHTRGIELPDTTKSNSGISEQPRHTMAAVTPVRTGVSPSSSPRLPSPPPMPELQFGPQSPLIGSSANELQAETANKPDDSARRRIRPGTRAADMARGPPLVPLNQLDSPFQLQEHLKALYADLTHGQSDEHVVPITRETALSIATPPQINDGEYVDKNLWLYELCRFLTMKANYVSCALMADSDPCTAQSCPEMRASEWQYLCAVHEPPKSCCAIDYVNHTLDWAANVLTSPKHFPSRLQLGGDPGSAFQSMRQLTNVFRRVYRIFAHAWFQHREVFWHIEATFGIYILFKTICEEYSLIPKDNYTIPAEAEGPRDEAETIQILRNGNCVLLVHQNEHDGDETATVATGATTRRHKHTPSTGSHVGTIAEGAEEEEEATSSPSKQTRRSPERSTARDHLGTLNIGTTDTTYLDQEIEDPTPTPAQAATEDPLDAAGKLPKHDDSFESEVRRPTGGSIRTGGPDLLGAILGHMEGGPEGDDENDKGVKTTLLDQDHTDVKPANEAMERIDLPDRMKTVATGKASALDIRAEESAPTEAETAEENATSAGAADSDHNDDNDEGEEVEVQLEQDRPVKEHADETDKTKEDNSRHVVSEEEPQQRQTDSHAGAGVKVAA